MFSEKEKSNFIHQIEQILDLTFLDKNASGNTCFVDRNEELRNEFKQFFTEDDLFFFLKSFEGNEWEIPEDEADFWKKVEEGKKI